MAQLGTTNISTTVVANTLGINTHNVRELCTSDNINKWAKYKPVCYHNTPSGDRDTIAKAKYNDADGTGEFGRHANGDYGLVPGRYLKRDFDNTAEQIVQACQSDWDYIHPQGTSRYPYRLGDFRGYDSEARPFLTLASVDGATWDSNKKMYLVNPLITSDITIRFNYNSKDDYPNWVCADDMVGVSGLDFTKAYIICAIYKDTTPNDTLVLLKSTVDEWGSTDGMIVNPDTGYPNDLNIPIDVNEFDHPSGNYVYFAICYVDDTGNNYILSLPYPSGNSGSFPIHIYVYENQEEAGLGVDESESLIHYNYVNSAAYISGSRPLTDVVDGGNYRILCSGRMSFRFTFKNTSDTARTYTTNYFRLREVGYSSNNIQLQEVWSETQGKLSSFTVPANGSITLWMPFEGQLVTPPITGTNTGIELELVYNDEQTLWYNYIQWGYGNGFQAK